MSGLPPPGMLWQERGFDICDCFGSLDHKIMVTILAEKIHDGRDGHLLVEHGA
jgi:hypothetical protein